MLSVDFTWDLTITVHFKECNLTLHTRGSLIEYVEVVATPMSRWDGPPDTARVPGDTPVSAGATLLLFFMSEQILHDTICPYLLRIQSFVTP